jgi:tetratricopeptide (TPR) repeat protein
VAQSPVDAYLRIYAIIQDADTLESSGQTANAVARYQEAQTALQAFQRMYPPWNPKVVSFRLNYLTTKLGIHVTAVPATTAKPTPPPAPISAEAAAELQRQVAELQENLRRIQDDKVLLEAKLREALAAQPAAVDPRELVRAQEQIKELQRENELLKTTPATPAAGSGSKALEDARKALAEANRQLETQTALAKNLASERETLQEQLKALSASPAGVEALRVENEILKKQLADSKTSAAKDAEAARQLAAAQTRITALQSDVEVSRLEKIALENRVKTLIAQQSTPPAVVAAPADLARMKSLETERDELARKLTEANQELSGRRSRAANARIEQLNVQIDNLRARIQVFEARAVPYTSEELALFKKPATQIADAPTKPEEKPISRLPSGVTSLVASAQRHFAAGEFDQAEKDYLEILRRDENNAYTLANLAAIQLERGNLADAEKNVAKAVASAPDDDYSLTILGQVKFRQEKYDESIEAFSRAAKLKPQSAEIQN